MRKIILLISISSICCFLSASVNAQDTKIRIIVKDSVGFVPNAIIIYDSTGKNAHRTTNSKGEAEFTILNSDIINLSVSHIGYKKFDNAFHIKSDTIINIQLQGSPLLLGGVVVTGHRKAITMEDGVLNVNVSSFSNNKSDRLLDVFKRMPGVIVTDDNITVNGHNALIYIDGVEQKISTAQLMKFLESLPASSIESVKLRTERLAEHDMNVGAVIEIKSKHQSLDGYNITISTDGYLYPQSSYRIGGDIIAMVKYKTLTGNLNLGASNNSRYYTADEKVLTDKHTTDIFQKQRNKKWVALGSLTLNWRPLPINGAINFYLSYYRDQNRRTSNQDYIIDNAEPQIGLTKTKENGDLLSMNIEYASADSLRNQFKVSYGLITGVADSDNSYVLNSNEDFSKEDMKGMLHILNAGYTYTDSIFTFKIGAKGTIGSLVENSVFRELSKSRFKEDENVWGFYGSGNMALSSKLSIYLGVRAEYTTYNISLVTEDRSTKSSYWNIAPSFSLNYKPVKNYSGSLRFSTNIARPNYYDLLPGITYINETEFKVGNPNLKTYTNYRMQLNNLLYNFIYISLGVNYAKKVFGTVYEKDEDENTIVTFDNYADYFAWTGVISVPFQFVNNKIRGALDLQGRAFKYINIKDEYYPRSRSKMLLYGSASLYIGYNATDRFSCFVHGSANSPVENLQAKLRGYFSLDAGIQYSFLKEKQLTVGLACKDMFKSHYKYTFKYLDVKRIKEVWRYNRSVNLTISFNFKKNEKRIKIHRNENDIERFSR